MAAPVLAPVIDIHWNDPQFLDQMQAKVWSPLLQFILQTQFQLQLPLQLAVQLLLQIKVRLQFWLGFRLRCMLQLLLPLQFSPAAAEFMIFIDLRSSSRCGYSLCSNSGASAGSRSGSNPSSNLRWQQNS